MIYETQLAVEQYFQKSWVGEIHFSNSEKHPNADEWIYLDVVPIFVEAAVSRCRKMTSMIYVTVYAPNKVASAQLADKVERFLYGVKLADTVVGTWRPVNQGEVYNGLHFRKISFSISNYK